MRIGQRSAQCLAKILLLFACLSATCPARGSVRPAASPSLLDPTIFEPDSAEHEVLLQMRDGTDGNDLRGAIDRIEGTLIQSFELVPGLHHVYSRLPFKEVQRRLQQDPNVESVRRNRLIRAAGASGTDEHFHFQWALENTGQPIDKSALYGTAGADACVASAWPITKGVHQWIAVLDAGISTEHEDIAANLWTNFPESESGGGKEGKDDDGNGYVDDLHGWSFVPTKEQQESIEAGITPDVIGSPDVESTEEHGTAVASILGARGGNTVGMHGVNWYCKIMPLKILARDGGGKLTGSVAYAIKALEYAVDQGARISSNSWGAQISTTGVDPDDIPRLLSDAEADFEDLQTAISNAALSEHLFVAAAGQNTGGGAGKDLDVEPFYPAAFDLENILSVTGSDYHDGFPSDFNYGALSVDLAAPATTVLIATDEDYSWASGTSYAVPHVAGAAALLRQWYGYDTGYAVIRELILDSVRTASAFQGTRKTASEGVLCVRQAFPPVVLILPKGPREDLLLKIEELMKKGLIRLEEIESE